MNENTTQLLTVFADKLGTTTEYLWSVLVSQAPVSATLSLISIIVLGALSYGGFSVVHHRINKLGDRWDDDVATVLSVVITFFLLLIFTMAFFIEGYNVVTGYLNPEYWALNQLLQLGAN